MSEVTTFFQDLAAYPVLSDQEARAAFVAYRAGDQARGHALVYSTLQKARLLLLRYSRAIKMEAADLAQDAAVLLLGCLETMPPEVMYPNGYLFRAVRWHLNEVYQAQKQEQAPLRSLDAPLAGDETLTLKDFLPAPAAVPLSPGARLRERRRLAALYRAFRLLPPFQQAALRDGYGLRFTVGAHGRGQPASLSTNKHVLQNYRRLARHRLRHLILTLPRCQELVPMNERRNPYDDTPADSGHSS